MHKRRTLHNLLIWWAVSALAAVDMAMLNPPVGAQSPSSIQPEHQAQEISDNRQRALGTVDYVAALIPDVPQTENQVTSYAALGEILWRYDQTRARDYFRTAFSTIDQVKADGSDKDDQQKRQRWMREKRHQLRLQVVQRVARLDPQLERELIDQWKAAADASFRDGSLDSHEMMDLATTLLADDPKEAINLAQASLDHGVPPDFGVFLQNLRQTNPDSANQLFDAALGTATQNQAASVDALLSLLAYAFPQGVEEAVSHGSSIDSARTSRLLGALALRLSQPAPATSIDRRVVSGSELSSAERASLIQQHLPLFERYAPQTMPALQSASNQLSTQLPPVGVQPSNAQAAAQTPAESLQDRFDGAAPGTDQRTRDAFMAQAAVMMAHQGDVQKAEQILRRIQDSRLRQQTRDMVNLEVALQAVAEDDFPRARRYALEISQVKPRAAVYVMAAEKLASQGENDRALFWLNEAYDFTSRLNDAPEKIWTLFRLIDATLRLDPPRAFEMAQFVVVTLNRVRRDTKQTSLTNTLEQSSLEEHLTQSFGQLGRADFDCALYLAMQLEALDLRVPAELAICRAALVEDLDEKSGPRNFRF